MYTHVGQAVLFGVSCFFVLILQSQVFCERISARDELVKDLLNDYHASVEPTGGIGLKFGLALLCVRYNKNTKELLTNAWERYSWTDFRLSWNPRKYDGIKIMRLPASLIWKPDIDCYNALEVEGRSSENAVIDYEGSIVWVPRSYYKTLCNNNDSKPECDLSFGSWTYDQSVLGMETEGTGVDLGNFMNDTCPWFVDSHTSNIKTNYYPCCKEPYSSLDIMLTLKPYQTEE